MSKQLLGIVILSLLAALLLQLSKEPGYGFPTTIGLVLGSTLMFVMGSLGLPAIAAGVYWVFEKSRMPGLFPISWTLWVFVVGSVAYGTYLNENSNALSSEALETRFRPDGCEYTVTFPDSPVVTSFIVPGLGAFPRAELTIGDGTRGAFLRVECLTFPGSSRRLLDDKNYLLRQSAAYAEANGFTNVEYQYEDTMLGRLVKMRGFKRVSNRPVTYEVYQYLGVRSLLSLYTGGASSEYPQRGVVAFLTSVQSNASMHAP